MATPGFKKVGDDLGNFATGGLIGMIATGNDHESSTARARRIVTVIYKAPKDTAAFETYYPETTCHSSWRASPRSGSPVPSSPASTPTSTGPTPAAIARRSSTSPRMEPLKKGIATPAFKKVGDDLGNFATGGLDALIGAETK